MMYQRKNSGVEAIQWTLNNYSAIIDFTGGNVALTADSTCVVINGQTVCENDWIIKTVGQDNSMGPQIARFSFMANDVFQDSYEPYQAIS